MVYGFNDDKSKAEVYTKDETYNKTTLDNLLKRTSFNRSVGTITAGNYVAFQTTKAPVPNGYEAVGVIAWSVAGSVATLELVRIDISADGEVTGEVHNYGSTKATNVSVICRILWVKQGFQDR